jgi:hypothetical protein
VREYCVWRNIFGAILSKAEVAAFKVQKTHFQIRTSQTNVKMVGTKSIEFDVGLPMNKEESSCTLGIKQSMLNVIMRLAHISLVAV